MHEVQGSNIPVVSACSDSGCSHVLCVNSKWKRLRAGAALLGCLVMSRVTALELGWAFSACHKKVGFRPVGL